MSFSQLRPLSLGEILDGAFTLYRRQFASMFLTALVPQIPFIVFYSIYAVTMMGVGGDPFTQPASTPSFGAASVVSIVAMAILFPIAMLCMVIGFGAITFQVSRAYTGSPVGTREALRRGVDRMWPTLGASVLWGILFMIGLVLCVVPGLLVAVAGFALIPAVVLERRGPADALRRSYDLSRNALGEICLLLVVVYLITALPGGAVAMFGMVGMMGGAMTGNAAAVVAVQAVMQVLSALVRALTIPFSMGCTVLMYYDRRVRTEALDVQMMAESLNQTGGETPAGYEYGAGGGYGAPGGYGAQGGYPQGGYGQGGAPGGYPQGGAAGGYNPGGYAPGQPAGGYDPFARGGSNPGNPPAGGGYGPGYPPPSSQPTSNDPSVDPSSGAPPRSPGQPETPAADDGERQ